ncbi:MAG: HAD-IA family hydrolase [Prosthecobacter sp.]
MILSDIGNVLVAFDFTVAAQRCAERSPFPAEALLHRLDGIKLPYEDGAMDDVAFVREAMAALEFSGTAAEFEQIWCEIFTENAAMATTLSSLSGKLPMHLLSNTSGLHKNYLLRTFGIFSHFQDGVYSYSARCSKPGEEIFHHTIAKLDLDPAQTFYIDDLPANIATAERLGFRTHLYDLNNHPALEQALNDWLAEVGLS